MATGCLISARLKRVLPVILYLSLLVATYSATHYVAPGGQHIAPYTNWVTAATNIQAALDSTTGEDAVLVSNGTYHLTAQLTCANPITLQSVHGAESTLVIAPSNNRCGNFQTDGISIDGFTFTGGTAGSGGGLYLNGDICVANCIISNNTATSYGGGIWCNDRTTIISNCIIAGNSASSQGGGVYRGTLHHNLIENNAASYGAGVYDSHASFSIIRNNTSVSHGGGAYKTTLYNCAITGNESVRHDGGGTYSCYLYNCINVFNTAGRYGGGSLGDNSYNSIIYYNHAPNGSNYWSGRRYNCCTAPGGGGIVTSADPQILDTTFPRLSETSPCIDRGNISYVRTDTDIDGEPRIWGDSVDIGCDEFYYPGLTGQVSAALGVDYNRSVISNTLIFTPTVTGKFMQSIFQPGDGTLYTNLPFFNHAYPTAGVYTAEYTVWNRGGSATASNIVTIYPGYTNYVSLTGSDTHPYTNWAMAAHTIQQAIDDNFPGGVICVTNGTYNLGGHPASGSLSNRVALTNGTVLCSVNGPAVTTIEGNQPAGPTAVRPVYINGNSRIAGFTLTGGATLTNQGAAAEDLSGGGLYAEAGASITNCRIIANTATEIGGGSYGGILQNCLIEGNSSEYDGGGCYGGLIQQSRIISNSAAWDGGGCYGARLENVIIQGNTADYGGGTARATNIHCTVVDNTARWTGGGCYHGQLLNSIAFDNTASNSWDNYYNTICSYTCTRPDPYAEGSITQAPAFMNANTGNYRLAPDSPGIDAGTDAGSVLDLDGYPRPIDGTPDMGAYERSPRHYVSLTGSHTWPYLDWNQAATTLQAAVDAAQEADIVLATSGVYRVGTQADGYGIANRVIITNAITLLGLSGATNCIVEGSGTQALAAVRCAWLGSGANLSGFTLRNGFTGTDGVPSTVCSGGGAWCAPGAMVSNCLVISNTAASHGGGLAGGAVMNSFIAWNQALYGGGASDAAMLFDTTIENIAHQQGGGVYASTASYSIVYFNQAPSDSNHADSVITHSCIAPDPGGTGNITGNPLLSGGLPWQLDPASPCIDQGTNVGVFLDLGGTPRPLDGNDDSIAAWDYGAFEYINLDADSDRDGLTDTNELYGLGTNPTEPDTDGDRQNDGAEVIAGVDPLDPASFFAVQQIIPATDQQLVLQWTGVIGRAYSVIRTTNLLSSWEPDPDFTNQPGIGVLISYTNSAPVDSQFFLSITVED
jgi:hypothetical protein